MKRLSDHSGNDSSCGLAVNHLFLCVLARAQPDLVTVIVILTGLIYSLAPGCTMGLIGGFILTISLGASMGAGAPGARWPSEP